MAVKQNLEFRIFFNYIKYEILRFKFAHQCSRVSKDYDTTAKSSTDSQWKKQWWFLSYCGKSQYYRVIQAMIQHNYTSVGTYLYL